MMTDPATTETVIEQGKALGTIEPVGWFERKLAYRRFFASSITFDRFG